MIITDFGGSSSVKGNTGPFWVASGLAVLSAIIVIFLVKPLTHDGMKEEDAKVCDCLSYCLREVHAPNHVVPGIPRRARFRCLIHGP